jgi:hypothetical protein
MRKPSKKRNTVGELVPMPGPALVIPLVQVIAPPDATLIQLAVAFASIRDGQVIYGREGIGWCASDPPVADGQKLAWDAVSKRVVWVNV